MKEFIKEFEKTGHIAWVNADIYPDGKIYTQEFTEWLAKRLEELERKAWECSVEMMEQATFNSEAAESGNVTRPERYNGLASGWKYAAYKLREAFGFPKSETPEKFKK